MRRAIAVAALAGAVLAGASACKAGPPCIAGHYDYLPQPVYAGKTTIITITPVWECDEYGAEPS